MMVPTCLAVAWILGSIGGCAHWSNILDAPKKPEAGLKEPQGAGGCGWHRLDLFRLGAEQESEPRVGLASARSAIDRHANAAIARRQWAAPGVIRGELPIVMQRWVEEAHQKVSTDLMEQAALAADVSSHVQKLQCRAGKRKEIVVRPQRSVPLVLLHHDGVAKGKSYDDPMLLFELKAMPKPDGSASLRLTPEIQYGPMVPNFVGQDFACIASSDAPTIFG